MTPHNKGNWTLQVTLQSTDKLEYKYACFNREEQRCVGYEQGPNRLLDLAQRVLESEETDASGRPKVVVRDIWSTQAAPTRAASYLHNQMLLAHHHHHHHHEGGVAAPKRDGDEVAKAVAEIAALKKRLQASQHDQVRLLQESQEAATANESERKRLQAELDHQHSKLVALEDECARLRTDAKQQEASRAQQSSAKEQEHTDAVASLNKRVQELTEQLREERARSGEAGAEWGLAEGELRAEVARAQGHAESALKEAERAQGEAQHARDEAQHARQEMERAQQGAVQAQQARDKAQLDAQQAQDEARRAQDEARREREEAQQARDGAHQAREEAAQAQAEAQEAQGRAHALHTTVATVEAVVGEFVKGAKDDAVRAAVADPGSPLHQRVGLLLQHFEERANCVKPDTVAAVARQCRALRDELETVKHRVRSDIAQGVEAGVRGLDVDMAEFIRGLEKVKAVHAARYRKQYEERKRLANEVVDLKGKIRVFGRARPFNKRELESGHTNVLAFPEQNRVLVGLGAEQYLMVDDVRKGNEVGMGENKIDEVKTYELDHIFPPDTTQEAVFEEVRHLVASVLDGYNVTVLAYGQTGSGKTFTMDGTDANPGLIRRSLALFFQHGVHRDHDDDNDDGSPQDAARGGGGRSRVLKPLVNVSVSMLEIYNEEIRDLLSDRSVAKGAKYEVRQTPDGGTFVPNLTHVQCESLEHALQIMDMGRENRKTSETKMNQLSSRSHMVFTTYVEITHPVSKHRTESKLHLVDLAGSERVSKSKASGEQLKEAMAINKSLSALGDVVAALTSARGTSAHVPFRNSKLTFLLQDSLCGSARTAMFVNLSPSSDNFWETISTLNFGARAASVELGQVQRNFESGELLQLRDQVKKLQAQLMQREERGLAPPTPPRDFGRGESDLSGAKRRDEVLKAKEKGSAANKLAPRAPARQTSRPTPNPR